MEGLWEGSIPHGAITILERDPVSGKSALSLDVAARLSRGASMPFSSAPLASSGVVILQREGVINPTLGPALREMGVAAVAQICLDLDTQLAQIESSIRNARGPRPSPEESRRLVAVALRDALTNPKANITSILESWEPAEWRRLIRSQRNWRGSSRTNR